MVKPEPRFSDEYIDYWANVFQGNPGIRAWYVSRGLGDLAFASFIQHPQHIMATLKEYRP